MQSMAKDYTYHFIQINKSIFLSMNDLGCYEPKKNAIFVKIITNPSNLFYDGNYRNETRP